MSQPDVLAESGTPQSPMNLRPKKWHGRAVSQQQDDAQASFQIHVQIIQWIPEPLAE